MVTDDLNVGKKGTKPKMDLKRHEAKQISDLKSSKAAFDLQFNSHENDPEFTADFRTAIAKVLNKMSENPDNEENKILKLLVSDEKRLEKEFTKVSK